MHDNVFSRHLDISPLNGRRSGKVICIFHQERTASLSVDLDAGVFHCFGCGVEGGTQRFRRLVGEPTEPFERPAPARTHSPVFDEAMRIWHRSPAYREQAANHGARAIGQVERDIREARRIATAAGDTEDAWDLLALAAGLERELWARE